MPVPTMEPRIGEIDPGLLRVLNIARWTDACQSCHGTGIHTGIGDEALAGIQRGIRAGLRPPLRLLRSCNHCAGNRAGIASAVRTAPAELLGGTQTEVPAPISWVTAPGRCSRHLNGMDRTLHRTSDTNRARHHC